MIPSQTLTEFPVFADTGTKAKPEDAKYSAGFQNADVLPYEWVNWLLNKASSGVTALNSGVTSIEAELNAVLTAAGITPSAATNDQVLNAIQYLLQVKTGTLANLTTTDKSTLVAAINEVRAKEVSDVGAINDVIPDEASSTNQLVTQDIVPSGTSSSNPLMNKSEVNTALTDYAKTDDVITKENETYSTTESETGKTWIDGKTIYRKVFSGCNFGANSGNWTSTDIATSEIPSIDNIIMATAIRETDKAFIHIGLRYQNSLLQYFLTDAFPNCSILILEYTKAS